MEHSPCPKEPTKIFKNLWKLSQASKFLIIFLVDFALIAYDQQLYLYFLQFTNIQKNRL